MLHTSSFSTNFLCWNNAGAKVLFWWGFGEHIFMTWTSADIFFEQFYLFGVCWKAVLVSKSLVLILGFCNPKQQIFKGINAQELKCNGKQLSESHLFIWKPTSGIQHENHMSEVWLFFSCMKNISHVSNLLSMHIEKESKKLHFTIIMFIFYQRNTVNAFPVQCKGQWREYIFFPYMSN